MIILRNATSFVIQTAKIAYRTGYNMDQKFLMEMCSKILI